MSKVSLMLLLVFLASSAPAQERVEVARDLWISAYESEREGNNGGSPRLKLKGIQEFFLIDFDPAPLSGRRVTRAQLHVHLEGPETLGRITVSSVAEPWVEGSGTGYARIPGASCFAWLRTDEQRWQDVDATGSMLGAARTIWGFGDASTPDADRWQIIPVDPAVVQARIDGQSHGFCVMDDVGSEYTRTGNTIDYRHFPNRYVASREGRRATAPYLTLWFGDEAPVSPAEQKPAVAKGAVKPASLPLAAPAMAGEKLPINVRDEFGEPLPALEFFAARGETIGFSVPVAPEDVAIDLPGIGSELFGMPEVAGQVDPLVPAGSTGAPVTGQTRRTFIDLSVDKDASPGRRAGTLRIGNASFPCAVIVWDFILPDHLSFLPQMNCYGLPRGQEIAYYRLAHKHRTVLNCLPYGWTGKVSDAPRIRPDGTWDWSEWDAKFGPLLDGSAFADLPRAAVPLEALYLPLNENWPMDHERHFRGGYWIESAYSDAYWEQFRNAAARFAKHFEEKGWTGTVFEFYLNNKVYFKRDRGNRWDACSAPWIFDEPVNTQDFWALRRFGLEFWRGVQPHPGARFAFRADISRPEWQRDLLDGVTSCDVVSGVLRSYRDRVIGRAETFQNLVYMYGSANRIGTPNVMPAAWCVETWALGADGVVPWQTIGKPGAWEKPDDLSLFYPTANGPMPSLRLKSFRAGQQLAEYLTLYTAVSGENRAAAGASVLALPGLRATLKRKSETDAGNSLFGPEARESLSALRLGLGHWLDGRRPEPRERWHDPRPPARDPAAVREIAPLMP